MKHRTGTRLDTARRIFSKPAYIMIAAAASILFFYLFRYLIEVNNYGIFLVLIPMYVIYALVITSGIIFSISLFAIGNSIASRRMGEIGGLEGIIIPSLGGLVASCGCAFPLLESILLFFGVSVLQAAGIASAINSYQIWILLSMITLNVILVYYYLGRISTSNIKRTKK
ncbi:MAG: hypothetical protein ACYCO0_00630 [Candidatus Micrarchaeaceae archaeon]